MTHETSPATIVVVGGIDTHKDLHMAAVVDRDAGRPLNTKEFSTTSAGYRALLRWMRGYGVLDAVGIEGTGSYGAGVMLFINEADVTTYEVDRPDRSDRRRRGKSDHVDAEMAARAVLGAPAVDAKEQEQSCRGAAGPPFDAGGRAPAASQSRRVGPE